MDGAKSAMSVLLGDKRKIHVGVCGKHLLEFYMASLLTQNKLFCNFSRDVTQDFMYKTNNEISIYGSHNPEDH